MKRIDFKHKLVAAALVVGLVAVATPGFACWGNGAGNGMGWAVQQSTLQGKASNRTAALWQRINAKYAELAAARAKDGTTIGQLKKLQGELLALQNRCNTQFGLADAQVPCPVDYGMRGGYGPMGGMMNGPNGGPAAGYIPCNY